jgi:glycosyltransferase involved in cell wall biosynthesis
MQQIGVLHIIDALGVGGAEKMAVSLVNHLSRAEYVPYICATRFDGALKDDLALDVGYVCLSRRNTFDIVGFEKLISFIRAKRVRIIHAHSTSLFLSLFAALMVGNVKLVWHDHSGQGHYRRPFLFRIALKKVAAVIVVTSALAEWAREKAGSRNVFLIPNFPESGKYTETEMVLPGALDNRLICVANLRPEKDHGTLLEAMKIVVSIEKNAHLLLVGGSVDPRYSAVMQERIIQLSLDNHVTWLGPRRDVEALLHHCAIGVLSSRSEGSPVSLLEYGAAGLATVVTNVGQCGEIIANDRTGLLVPPGDVNALANAMLKLLRNPDLRKRLGAAFAQRVHDEYSAATVVTRIEAVYRSVLGT